MVLVHCDETLQSGNMEKAKELSEKVKELYEIRQSIQKFYKDAFVWYFQKAEFRLGVKHALQGPKGVFKKD